MHLTDATIRSLQPTGRRHDVADDGVKGLKLRVAAGGAKSFSFIYRVKVRGDWRSRRIAVGPYPSITLAAARKTARKLRVAVDEGRDPWFEQRTATTAMVEAPTLAGLFALYDDRMRGVLADSTREIRRCTWNKHGAPFLGDRPAAEISRGEIKERVDEVARQAGPGAAGKLKELLSCMYGWAQDNDHLVRGIDGNPAARVKTPKLKKRKRFLGLDEISTVWHGVLETRPQPRAEVLAVAKGQRYQRSWRRKIKDSEEENRWRQAMAIRLVIAMGLRPIEVRLAKQDAFHIGERRWLIDADDHKTGERTGEPHLVLLNDLALDIVQSLIERVGPHVFLIPNVDTGKPFGRKALVDFIEARQHAWKLPHFTPYDLRRTFSSQLAAHGANPLYVDLCQAHKLRGVQFEHYNWYDYQAEKRGTWDLWSSIVSKAIDDDLGPNVVRWPSGVGPAGR